jgi:hypothetical protein
LSPVRLGRVIRGAGLLFLFIVLLVLPSLVRVAYYYRGFYRLPDVSRPDHDAVRLPTMAPASWDRASVGETLPLSGRQVVIDRAHGNVVDDAELNVLVSHLTARGMQIVFSRQGAGSEAAWTELLRGALALIVISPHESFLSSEVEAVVRFVEQGGRVVLIGDPSRFAFKPVDGADELADVFGNIQVPESDVAALNSLASSFGLAFADDYLYNTVENAGNYQYVILKDLRPSPLTDGLSTVVFYAARSISAGEETLIAGDEHTASSLSERRGGLAVMSLGGGGRVLAVADYTFMTEPYSAVADNSRLIANMVDYVAGAERTFGLTDFPHFLNERANLIYLPDPVDGPVLPAEAIALAARLRSAFDAVGKKLVWYEGQVGLAGVQDRLYVGLYAGLSSWPDAEGLLASKGITFTLETSAQVLADHLEGPDARAGQATRSPDTAPPGTGDLPTPTPVPLRDWIHVAGMGSVDARQTALFYQNEEGAGQTLLVLAFEQDGLADAVQRLLSGDYADCLLDEDRKGDPERIGLALCPTAYRPPVEGPSPTPRPGEEGESGPPGVHGGILVVSDDDGEGRYDWWTGAYEWADIAVEAGYRVTLWSTAVEGELDLTRMSSFDAVVWCTGDYYKEGGIPDVEDLSTLLAYLDGGGRLILSGAFIGPEEGEQGLLVDVQVAQAGHPLAKGFEAGQVIRLDRFTADEDYAATVLSETDPQAIVFSRGPDSELAGRAVITVEENVTRPPGQVTGSRTVWIGVPIYLLPVDERYQLARNAIEWALE